MNKYQRLVVVAVMNALLFVLFPPFTSQPLARGALPGFDGFYPLFTQLGRKPVFTTLLSLQLMFVGINTLAGWLVLQNRQAPGARKKVLTAEEAAAAAKAVKKAPEKH